MLRHGRLSSNIYTAVVMRFVFSTGGKLVRSFVYNPKRFSHKIDMEKHGIVPDVIKVPPSEVAEIKYGNLSLALGNELTPTQVKVNINHILVLEVIIKIYFYNQVLYNNF